MIPNTELRTEEQQRSAATAISAVPRIAVVTPAFNAARYIEATIRSVLAQNYPNLDYFIVDGGSTDGTVEIIKKYENQISGWISEPDRGMYDAINKGFAHTSGEIMGWINASDIFHVSGLSVVAKVFQDLPQVEWITARPTYFDEQGQLVKIEPVKRWSRNRFLAGANRTIQQESTYWRRSLWERAGARVDASQRMAGDFELWVRFFRFAQLYSVDSAIAGWRSHANGLGQMAMDQYHGDCEGIIEQELKRKQPAAWVPLFRRMHRAFKPIPGIRGIWRILAYERLYSTYGSDLSPVIEYKWGQVGKWGFRSK
jgi:hypothetical protein